MIRLSLKNLIFLMKMACFGATVEKFIYQVKKDIFFNILKYALILKRIRKFYNYNLKNYYLNNLNL